MKKHIPNTLTCCNLLSGALSIYCIFNEQYAWAFLLIIIAAVFDFLDGFSARLLGVSSPIGKELDSLADDISFGLAPAMMLFLYLLRHSELGAFSAIALIMAAFAALRLAKFNLDTRQTESFIGLATPANTIFWMSLISTLSTLAPARIPLWAAILLLCAAMVSSYLLISEIPFFALKFHNYTWKDNAVRFLFIFGSLLMILLAIGASCLFGIGWLLMTGCVIILWYFILNFTSNL